MRGKTTIFYLGSLGVALRCELTCRQLDAEAVLPVRLEVVNGELRDEIGYPRQCRVVQVLFTSFPIHGVWHRSSFQHQDSTFQNSRTTIFLLVSPPLDNISRIP